MALLEECVGKMYNKDGDERYKTSYTGVTLDPEAFANPCGLIAYTMFNGNPTIFFIILKILLH